MNYFAHGRAFVDAPYALAGTAVPDWLSASDRAARLRRAGVKPSGEPVEQDLARGVRRHMDDDLWFHRTPAFLETSGALAARVRASDPGNERLRAVFWGHVLVETLLDAHLIAQAPERLDRYYAALDDVDPARIEAAVTAWTTRRTSRLARFIERFRETRFLYGYVDDAGFLQRMAGLARRVGLPRLPRAFAGRLPDARALVAARAEALLTPVD